MFCIIFSVSGITGFRNQEKTKYFADSASGSIIEVEYLLKPLGKQKELASIDGDNSDESEDEETEADRRPEDKENLSPNEVTAPGSVQDPKKTGRKRKRDSQEREQTAGGNRRQRIRQYYNGASHGCASAVQLFAMAMQVRLAG